MSIQRTQTQAGRRQDLKKQMRSESPNRSSSNRNARQELSERSADEQAREPAAQSGSLQPRASGGESAVPEVPRREGRDPTQAERSDAERQGKVHKGEAMPRAFAEQAARPHWVKPGSEEGAENEDDSAADESLSTENEK